MRTVFCRSVGLVLLSAVAAQVSAQTYVVTANDLYVRAAPGGFAIGTLYQGDHFRRQQTSSNGLWYWGRCGGTAQMCGWVGNGSLNQGGTVSITCSGSGSTATGLSARHHLLANWAKCVNDYVPGQWYIGGDTPSTTQINAGMTAHLYGNYDGTSFHHQITTTALNSSAQLAWRWVSDSGEAVMVKQENGPWAFMRRDKLPTMLRYKDGNFRTDNQGAGN
jgi:hypothetical protein